nr:PAS domain S-box protein [bacterium]
MKSESKSRGWRMSWFLSLYGLVAASVLLAAIAFYRAQMREVRLDAEEQLLAIADLKADEIVRWRSERVADAEVIKRSTSIQNAALSMLEGRGSDADARLLAERAELYRDVYGYRSLVVVDPRGNAVFASEGADDAFDESDLASVESAVKSGEVIFSDFHRHGDESLPILGLFVPVRSKGEGFAGAVVLQIDPRQFLYPLIQSWPVPSDTAETLLVRREGDEVLFLNELRHRKGTAMKLRLSLSEGELPAAMAVQGVEGIVEGRDYRGIKVIAALKAVPGSTWFLSAKVDEGEVLLPLRRLSAVLFAIVMAVFLVGAVAGLFLMRRQGEFLALERRALEEHFHSFSKYAADAIFLVDDEFRFREVNDSACERYGYTKEEFLSMRVTELHFEEEHPEFVRLMGDVREGGKTVFEFRHRRSDGSALPSELSLRAVE